MKSPIHLSFIFKEQWKLLATFVVAGFYLYFWIEGPIQHHFQPLNLDHQKSEYSEALLVGSQQQSKAFGTVEAVETGGFGHAIILDRNERSEDFGVLISAQNNTSLNAGLQEKIRSHASTLQAGHSEIEIRQTENLPYAAIEGKEKLLYFESGSIIKDIRGYAGPVNIGIFVNEDGKIHSLHHIASEETESYLQKIIRSGFYDQFAGLQLSGQQQVDAVSGATLTSEAIAHTATVLMETATPAPLANFADVDVMDDFTVEARLSWWWILHISLIFLLFLYGFQKKWRKSKKGVMILSLLSVVYIGFFLNNSFTYVSFLHPFIGTSISTLVGLYALFALLGAIWGKNTYCKYVCPYGNAQRLLLHIAPKKAASRFFIPNKWIKRIRGGIAVALITGVLLGLRGWSNFEPFPDFFGMEYISLWFFGSLAIVVFTVKYPMIWCRLLCPTGSVLDFISDAVNYKRKK